MAIRLILLWLLLFTGSVSFAQKNQTKSSLSFGIGPAMPIGSYGGSDIHNEEGGFARAGQIIQLTYNYQLSQKFSFVSTVMGMRNPLNVSSLEEGFKNTNIPFGLVATTQPGQVPVSFPSASFTNWKFKKDDWVLGAVLVGGQLNLSANSVSPVQFTTRLLLGATYVQCPKLDGTSTTDTSSAHITQTDDSSVGFSYLIGGGVTYQLNKKVFLLANLEYFGTSRIKFEDMTATIVSTKGTPGSPGYTIQQTSVTGESGQVISTINLVFGIGFKF